MKMTVSNYDFRRVFLDIRPNNFSLMGLDCLFDYFEELEGELGDEIELDVIAICCDYAEMEYDDIVFAYDLNLKIDDFDELGECEQHKAVEEWLQEWTTLIGATTDGTLVFAQNF